MSLQTLRFLYPSIKGVATFADTVYLCPSPENLLKVAMKISLFFLFLLVSTVQSNIKILNTPDGEKHPEPCALTCSGVSRHDDARYPWFSPLSGKAGKAVDITGCGFVAPPVISATIANNYCAAMMPYWTSTHTFYVMSVGETTPDTMRTQECDVSWIAVGYSC